MNKLKQPPVGKQVLLTFATLCAILLVIGGLFFFSLRTIERSNQLQQSRALDKLALIDDTAQDVGQMQAEALREVLASDIEEIKSLDHTVRVTEKINLKELADYEQLIETEKERQLYDRVMQARKAYWEPTQQVLALGLTYRDAEATKVITSTQAPAYDEYLNAINKLIKYVETDAEETAEATARFISQIRIVGNVLAGIAISIAVGTGFAVARIVGRLKGDNRFLQIEVTERKRAEETLRESEEKFRQLADNISDVFWTTSPDLQQLYYVSPAYEQIWGRSVESVYANPLEWSEAILPEERKGVFAIYSKLSEDEPSVSVEYRIARPDGTVRWIFSRGFQVRDAAGKVVRITGVASDITERKRAERHLTIQYAISRVLAESSTLKQASVGILKTICENLNWDTGKFWNVNRQAGVMQFDDMWIAPDIHAEEFILLSRQIGFARGVGLPGRVWKSGKPAWIPDIAVDANFPRAAAAQKAGLHGAFSFPILAGDEVVGVIEFFSREIRQPDEELLSMCAVLGSQLGQFFERKRLEERLIQSQKMETVGKLAGGIAHEFNSILTAIIGQSELLLGNLPAGSPLAKHATEISKAAGRAATLTRQLLAYGRKQFLQPETLDLNRVLASMEGMFRHLMGGDVDTQIVPAHGLQAVKADAGQIEQVIMNMAMNARDAMPNGGKFTLETANVSFGEESVGRYPELKAGDYVMLAITDTGTGMGAEVKARVFEPFFSTKGVGQGTGLGLPTCYGIIKQSGGHISVYSEPGRGTTFKIYLPQIEQQAAIPIQRPGPPDLPRGTETILLVEDDPALREMATTLLRQLGYTVLAAANGIEALSLKQQRGIGYIDLLFTDVIMPHMSGKELSDRMRALYPHTRILFTSAYTENAIVHQGVLDDGVELLQKPFTPSALAFKLREVLDQPSAPKPDTRAKLASLELQNDEKAIHDRLHSKNLNHEDQHTYR